MTKRGRKPNPRLPHEKIATYSFALDPKRPEEAIGIQKIRTWFEYCVREFEKPKGGWSQNAMLKLLAINLRDDTLNDTLVSLVDMDTKAQIQNAFEDMKEEIRALRKMVSDLQTDLSRKQFSVIPHNSYEQLDQPLGHITERFGSSKWTDDDE